MESKLSAHDKHKLELIYIKAALKKIWSIWVSRQRYEKTKFYTRYFSNQAEPCVLKGTKVGLNIKLNV